MHQVVGAFAVGEAAADQQGVFEAVVALAGQGDQGPGVFAQAVAPSPAERVSQACSGRIAEMVRALCPRGPHRCLEEIART
ncbi:hypothetical protein K4B79_47210 [Streptomyces lincolnensis]|uniref:hypothetical protein n=1 Tax=Streptomyces lincolnensis TaxID=1915 RepID=UPI001E2922B8|nr:hypothetical protein [Streptomyces lincolnensis]MCD7445743.1 hypothetical protein [Streptomyces lincolnensis]